jgi:phosphoribosylanthranilate isomerase
MSTELKLKVCGMRDADNIRAIAAFQPDYMGFIFYRNSPRWVGEEFVMPDLPQIKKVGVFVNATSEEMLEAVTRHGLDVLQLHGNESVGQVKEMVRHGVAIWKVFNLDAEFDFRQVEAYEPFVEVFLFDTKGKHFGGNATTFDWTVLKKYHQRIPFMLSGGLNATNVAGVHELTAMNIRGVDLNSGVESAAGVKDPEKLRNVILALRNNDNKD